MKFIFKKLLLFYVFGIILTSSVNASTLKIEKFVQPIKLANKISQPISLSFVADGNWRLLVEAMESRINNQDNPNYSLPVSRMELTELNGTPISNFGVGKVIEINNRGLIGVNGGVNNLNFAINTNCFDSDRPGNYSTDIKFTLIDNSSNISEDFYNLRFTKDEISSIDFSNKFLKLSMDKNRILQKNCSQNLPTPLSLYVSSNKNWKLYINKPSSSKDKELTYFVRVLGGDSAINCNLTVDYIQLSEKSVLLASGKATINEVMNNLDKKTINIDYLIKGPENKFISAGSRSEEFEYRLETED